MGTMETERGAPGKARIAIAGLGLLLLGACNPLQQASGPPVPENCGKRTIATIGGPISLVDQDGMRVTEATYAGKNAIVYFGFTHCPDVCPMSLTTIGAALELLPPDTKAKFQPLLVSLDPVRDTPEVMRQYTASGGFPPGLRGLTGTPEEVKAAASAFKAAFNRVDQPNSELKYVIDHTSITYVMNSKWKLATFFTEADAPADMANCLAAIADGRVGPKD
jgi:protein SCO1